MLNIPQNFYQVKEYYEKPLLQIYTESVPYHPLATNKLGSLSHFPKDIALSKNYIQHNKEGSIKTLIIDVDDSEGHYKWDDLHAPPPNFAIMNPVNGHVHLAYFIRNKIFRNRVDNMKAFRLLSAIETALIKKVEGDPYYTNLISKNLLSEHWSRYFFNLYEYDLDYFFDYLVLPPKTYKENTLFNAGLGRNCTMFDQLRFWAYSSFRDFNYNIDLDFFINHLFAHATRKLNSQFIIPLGEREIFGIAKSIGKWTYIHQSKSGFVKWQAKGRAKVNLVKTEKATTLYKEIKEIKINNPGLSVREIASLLNIGKSTVSRALNFIEPTSDDQELFDDQPELF